MLVDVCLLIKPFRGHAETVLDPLVKYSKPNAGNIYYIVGEEWQPFVCGNALSCFGFSAEDTPTEQPALRLVTSVRRCLTSWPEDSTDRFRSCNVHGPFRSQEFERGQRDVHKQFTPWSFR